MKVTFHLPTDRVQDGDEFVSLAAVNEMTRGIERAGIAACFVTDHPMPADRWLETGGHHALDPFVALSFAAAATTTLKLHTYILVLPYRNPFIAAKSVASLDVLSQGRLILGVGAGYLAQEFEALGASVDDRNKTVEENLEAMRRVWSGQSVVMEGRSFKATGNTALPVPLQRPQPPVWMGGNSEAAIRRAVTICDGWAPFRAEATQSKRNRTAELSTVEQLKAKIAFARDVAEEAGRQRPFDVCTSVFGFSGDPTLPENKQAYLDHAGALKEAGVTWLVTSGTGRNRAEWLDRMSWFGQEIAAQL